MIPLNTFTPEAVYAPFLPPLNDPYAPLTMRAPGGVAIGDGSQGRETQFWTVSYDGANITVTPASTGTPYTLAVAGVLTVSLAFDSNMAVALGYMKADGGYLYFFNGVVNAYQTNYYPTATACRVCVDKTTPFFSGQSDVLFCYTRGEVLYWRQQRDRYATEYTVGPTLGKHLQRVGPTSNNRFELELVDA